MLSTVPPTFSRLVVKIGSAVLCCEGAPSERIIRSLAKDIRSLRDSKKDVILVCSGAIASGKARLATKRVAGLTTAGGTIRTHTNNYYDLLQDQIFASIGQAEVISCIKTIFNEESISVGQMLVTRADFASQRRYESIKNVTEGLIRNGAIPIFNENDVLVPEELDFGDNDELAAIVAATLGCEWLAMLTAASGIYIPDKTGSASNVLREITDIDSVRTVVGNGKSPMGRGGIQAKLDTCYLVASLGVNMWILDGREDGCLSAAFLQGREVGTLIRSQNKRVKAIKGWLSMAAHAKGELVVSAFCADRLRSRAACSVLAIGVESCNGQFEKGDVVTIKAQDGAVLARGKIRMDSKSVHELLLSREKSERSSDYNGVEIVHYDQIGIAPELLARKD